MDETKECPKRRDGSYRSFWYDGEWHPGHILHRDGDGNVYRICVGHGPGESKAWT